MFVKKQDLQNNYNFEEIKKSETKERNRWMWIILIGCFLLQMFPYCVALNLTGVFVGSDWQYWTMSAGKASQTIIGLTFTVGAVSAALAGPFIAKMFNKKINMRLVYSIGVIVAIIGFVGSGINSIIINATGEIPSIEAVSAILWISNIISQIGVMIFSGLGVNNLISKWWPSEKRGFALGLAFTGGSVGNIWMQQLIGVIAPIFGNVSPREYVYDPLNEQYATYLIMGCLGLVAGLIVVMFICRKPLPPIDILNAKFSEDKNENKIQVLEASPLNTRKYPIYWILCIGYLILQMGTVHAANNTAFITNALVPLGANYNSVVALGNTLFGVFCLIGNFGGGILNDKLGPTKSIFLAGMIQCLAIFFLIFSVTNLSLVYVYYVLAGLSVYVYTSTPAFISGRLYGSGQSNNHMAILGLFIALGYAIVNSVSGSIVGDVSNSYDIFGKVSNGNYLAWGIFAICCMGVGTIIVSLCCAIITKKGIKGLLEYSPTKYTRVILFRHSLAIRFAAFRIKLTGKDFRKLENRIEKMNKKRENDEYIKSFESYLNYVVNQLSSSKLSKKELELITIIFLYNKISKSKMEQFFGVESYHKELKSLISKKVINQVEYKFIGSFYELSEEENEKLISNISELGSYELILKENKSIDNTLLKLDAKLENKISKINEKIELTKNQEINQVKKEKLVAKSNSLIKTINENKPLIMEKISHEDEWTKYKKEYELIEKQIYAEQLKNKLETNKENKINSLQKKIFNSQYVNSFNKLQQIDGHDLLINYYKDKWLAYDNLISKRVKDDLKRKEEMLESKINSINIKINKNKLKREKIFG